MGTKGNRIENWEEQYKPLGATYTQEANTPTNLDQMDGYKFVHRYIIDYLSDRKDLKILEAGCGGARNALYLALQGLDVTCSDFSPEGIRLAQTNFNAFGAKGTFLLDDLMHSKIPEEEFDCVMSFGLLEHFEDLRPVIKNLTRLVKPQGLQIHLVIPKKFSVDKIRDFILFPVRLLLNRYRPFPHYENNFSIKQYCDIFKEYGNEIIKCEPNGLIKPLIMFPFGIGDMIVKLFSKQILSMNAAVRHSSHPFIYFLSPTLIYICRKK